MSKSNRVDYAIAAIGVLVMVIAISLANARRRAVKPSSEGPAVTAVIRHNQYLMDVKNTGAFEWKPVTLWLNKAESDYVWEGDLKPGETKQIHLRDFAKKDGTHFNPEKDRVGMRITVTVPGHQGASYWFTPEGTPVNKPK